MGALASAAMAWRSYGCYQRLMAAAAPVWCHIAEEHLPGLSHAFCLQVVPLWEPWPLLPWHGAAQTMATTKGLWQRLRRCTPPF